LASSGARATFLPYKIYKNCLNREDFRQKIESIEDMQRFYAPLKKASWADIRGSDNGPDQTEQVKKHS
jgi:hypothetical protein